MSDQAYVSVDISTDVATLADNAIDHLRDSWPGWTPREGSLAVRQIEAIAPLAFNAIAQASQIPPEIFRKFGTDLYGIGAIDGTPANATTRWTLSDTDGHTIEAGTPLTINGFAFTVDADVTVASGSFVAPSVGVTAVDNGTDANGLTGPVEQGAGVTWVDLVEVVGSTAGGLDGESDASYRNRFSTLLTLMSLAPVTADNFAVLARFAGVQVGRSTAVPGYNPADGTYDNGRYMFIAVADPNGNPMTSGDRAAIQNFLRARRETNFVINVDNHGEPPGVYVEVDVTYEAVFYASADTDATEALVATGIQDFLSPLVWGKPLSSLGATAPWVNESKVRKDKVIAVIDNLPGVNYVVDVTLADHDGAITPDAAGDLQLIGPAPLTTPGTITHT